MDVELIYKGDTYFLSTLKGKDGWKLKINDEENGFDFIEFNQNSFSLNLNGKVTKVYVAQSDGKAFVHINGTVVPVELITEESESEGGAEDDIVDGKQMVHAPMPGKIVKIPVEAGQKVSQKDILCVVEAMKMENEIRAVIDGVVKEVNYKDGDLVGTEETILTVEISE